MTVSVLVPRRADGGRRDHLWRWVADRWATLHPDYQVVEGHHEGGPFNRSAALNDAASRADGDVIVVSDSDSFVAVSNLIEAVDAARNTGKFVLAYDRFCYLSRSMSDRVMDGFDGNWWDGVEWSLPGTCSSMAVLTRDLWDEIGGGDEGFVGWGGEDIAISLSAQMLGGGLMRVPGEVWHLWHPTAPHGDESVWVERMQRYAAADTPDAMRHLIRELRS